MTENEDENASPLSTDLVASRGFQKSLANPHTIIGLQRVANFTAENFAETGAASSIEDVNEKLSSEKILKDDEQVAIDELDALFRRYSSVPIQSVEGLVKLHNLVLESYRSARLVPPQTRTELERLEQELQAVYASRDLFLQRRLHEERALRQDAEHRFVESERRLTEATTKQKIDGIKVAPRLVEAEAQAAEQTYTSRLRKGLVENTSSLLHKTIDNDRLEKTIDAHKRTVGILWKKLLLPLLIVLVSITFVLSAYTLLVEIAGNEVPAWLGLFDQIRHSIFDGLIPRPS